jgi:osmoprotectant transport system substrate-binding protein
MSTVSASQPSVLVTSVLDDDAITIGSFNFPESEVLAEVYAQTLEARGFRVQRELNVGPRELLIPSLQRGLVELVPEYAGSLLGFLGGTASSDPATTHQELAVQLAQRGLTALSAAPAEDRNSFAISATTAASLSVERLSDLTSFAPGMTFGGPAECEQRPLCLKGLEDVYGLHFKDYIPLDAGGPLTAQALRDGTIDIGLLPPATRRFEAAAWSTYSTIATCNPRERHAGGLADGARVVRPGLADALNAVSALLRTSDLREMNAAMADGASAADVARGWLTANGFTAAGVESITEGADDDGRDEASRKTPRRSTIPASPRACLPGDGPVANHHPCPITWGGPGSSG